MTILVKFNDSEVLSWGIVELQGELESRVQTMLQSQFVGDLHCTNQEGGIPILIIGHHILYGKSVKLEKPFAVMQRLRTDEKTEYTIKAIVKHKLVFKTRPKPIIANVPKML
uniref:Chromosome transmission fidelity protein 8 homolog n=1 Tax=Clastoptera arizonana TaxID=38151 RepID=A0A1B6DT75_9HEMI